MKRIASVLLIAVLALTLVLGSAVTVSAANKMESESFVTGGGSLKDGNKVAWTFAGNVGLAEDDSVVGQFQINDHMSKETWHCHGDFALLDFYGEEITGPTGPSALHNTAIFIGEFTSNRGETKILQVTIEDVNEPGRGYDTIQVVDLVASDILFSGYPIDTGNFQIHGGEASEDPNQNY